MIDPEAFEIAFNAVTPADGDINEDEEAILNWQHFHGDGVTSGTQQIYDPGHPAEVAWILPDEDPDEL
jgi:hypothetical protein